MINKIFNIIKNNLQLYNNLPKIPPSIPNPTKIPPSNPSNISIGSVVYSYMTIILFFTILCTLMQNNDKIQNSPVYKQDIKQENISDDFINLELETQAIFVV